MKSFSILLALMMTSLAAGSDDNPTVEEVNKDPEKWVGKTLVFDRVELRGDAWVGKDRMQLIVKTPGGTQFERRAGESQNVRFALPDKGKEVMDFVNPLKNNEYYPARLTCVIERGGKKSCVAVVKRVDLIRYETKASKDFEGIAKEGFTVEEVNKDPFHFGRVLFFDHVQFNGDYEKTGNVVQPAVLTPAKTLFKTTRAGKQNVVFRQPGGYTEDQFQADKNRDLRIMCMVKEFAGMKKPLLMILRIDLVAYEYKQK